MRIRFNPCWLLISALLLSFQFCRAQVLPGTISFDLGSSNAPGTQLWDLSGSYRLDLTVVQKNGLQVPFGMTFNMVQDAQGRLSGITNDIQDMEIGDNSFFAISYTIIGKATGSFGIAHAHFVIHITGSGTLAGQDVPFFIATVTVDADTDPASGQLLGTKLSKISADFPGFGGLRGNMDFFTALPPGVDGTWTLALQLAALNTISGSGFVETPSKTLGFDIHGMFKNEVFKLHMTGSGGVADTVSGIGSTATILMTSTLDSISVNGKLLGQKVSFIFP